MYNKGYIEYGMKKIEYTYNIEYRKENNENKI